MRILVYSTNLDFYILLEHVLIAGGHAVDRCRNIADVRAAFISSRAPGPDAVLLDCPLSDHRVAETCRSLKANGQTGNVIIVAIIASGSSEQLIELAATGIDEVFIRPFDPGKLLDYLRSRSTAKASGAGVGALPTRPFRLAELRVDFESGIVEANNQQVFLRPIELALLRELMAKPGRVFSRRQLVELIWPDDISVQLRTIDVHIGHLRKRLRQVTRRDLIRTVRSAGYALDLAGH